MPEVEEREGVVSPPPQTALSGGRSALAGLRHSTPPPLLSSPSSGRLLSSPPHSSHWPRAAVCAGGRGPHACARPFSSMRRRTNTCVWRRRRAEGNSSASPTLNNPPCIPPLPSPTISADRWWTEMTSGHKAHKQAGSRKKNESSVTSPPSASRQVPLALCSNWVRL